MYPISEFALDLTYSDGSTFGLPVSVPDSTTAFSLAVRPSTLIDYEAQKQYNLKLLVCAPRSVDGYFSVGGQSFLNPSICRQQPHQEYSVAVTVLVIDVNEPPKFQYPTVAVTSAASGNAVGNIGFALATIVSDPDSGGNNPGWADITFTLQSGTCGSPRSQLRSANSSVPDTPFIIKSDSGQVMFSVGGAPFSFVLNTWRNPMDLCVVASNGGGIGSTIGVNVLFTDVAATLELVPSTVEVVHYNFGVSLVNVSVLLNTGSRSDVGWRISNFTTDFGWVFVQSTSSTQFSLGVNSSAVWNGGQRFTAIALIPVTTNGGCSVCMSCFVCL